MRGLAAIVTSLPPIPSEGIIKRPGSWPIANWGHDVGLRLGDRLVVLGLHRESRCYRIQADDELVPESDDAALTELAVACFQTAFELFQSGRYQLPPSEGTAIAMASHPPL